MGTNKIKQFFSNNFETNLEEGDYGTHFFANDYNTSRNAVIDAGKKLGYTVSNVDDKFKEVLLVSKTKGELIVSLTSISYYETAIDIKVTTHYIIAGNRCKKKVLDFFEILDRFLNLKRKGGSISEY